MSKLISREILKKLLNATVNITAQYSISLKFKTYDHVSYIQPSRYRRSYEIIATHRQAHKSAYRLSFVFEMDGSILHILVFIDNWFKYSVNIENKDSIQILTDVITKVVAETSKTIDEDEDMCGEVLQHRLRQLLPHKILQ